MSHPLTRMQQNNARFDVADVASIQNELVQLVKSIPYTPIGPDIANCKGHDVVNNVIIHRFLNKYYVPVDGDQSLRVKAISDMLKYDADGLTTFRPWELDLNVRHVLYNARQKAHEIFSTFRFSDYSVELPSGESFVGQQGDVSIYAKLKIRSNWCVTPDCLDLFTRVVFNTPGLKRSAKSHMQNDGFNHKKGYRLLSAESASDIPFKLFAIRFKRFVNLVHGSRIETVPKNNQTDRCINIECMGNMIVQRCIASLVIGKIKDHFDIDLYQSQHIHKLLLRDPENATIDFKNASNSNWLSVIDWFFPKKFVSFLRKSRSRYVSHDINGYEELVELNMLAPMGNGFTFEVMTMLLLCISRELDSFSHVFGDDVIIDRNVASLFSSVMESIGWVINTEKSFTTGPFRESCGGFYHDEVGFLTSFDNWYVTNELDCVVFINKVGILKNAAFGELRVLLDRYHTKLISMSPTLYLIGDDIVEPYTPIFGTDLTIGVIVSKSLCMARRKSCLTSMTLFKKSLTDKKVIDIKKKTHAKLLYSVHAPVVVNKPYRRSLGCENIRCKHTISFYLWNGRISRPVYRRSSIQHIVSDVFDSGMMYKRKH